MCVSVCILVWVGIADVVEAGEGLGELGEQIRGLWVANV